MKIIIIIIIIIIITLLAMQTAVIATGCVCLSICHVPVFRLDKWTYDSAVFSIRQDNHSSFWKGNVYPDMDHPQWGCKSEAPPIASKNLTNNRP